MRLANRLLFTILWFRLSRDCRGYLIRNLRLLNQTHSGHGEAGYYLVIHGRSIVTIGPMLARRLGYNPAEMIGENIYDFILARNHALMFAFVQSGIAEAYITLHMKTTIQKVTRVTFNAFRLGGQIYLHALAFAQQGYPKRLTEITIPVY